MALMIVQNPPQIKELLKFYGPLFTKPQFKHFTNFVSGLIVSDNKTIQEINDCFRETDQSSMNRFLTESKWDCNVVNGYRIKQIKEKCKLSRGIFICDSTLLHKTGKHMEKANYHYSGITKKTEWGHLLVDSIFTDNRGNTFPIRGDIYIREVDADEEYPFKTSREICLEQLDFALQNKLPIWLFMADSGFYADYLIQEIKTRGLRYIVGIKGTQKISISGNKRESAGDYSRGLRNRDFKKYKIDGDNYFIHTREIYTRGIGKEKLIISYKEGDENNKKIYTTDLIDASDECLLNLLIKRWKIECWHRDAKQHLGIEDYQVRDFGAIQRVVCAVILAYTLIFLCRKPEILSPFKRALNTIGEWCRYLRLVAMKGWWWIKDKAKNIDKFSEILNCYVFVKNAKV